MKTLVTSELVFKIPIKVYMCVLKHNISSWPQMISFLTYFKIANFRFLLRKSFSTCYLILKREFSRSSFFRLSRFKIADALACESNHSLHPFLTSKKLITGEITSESNLLACLQHSNFFANDVFTRESKHVLRRVHSKCLTLCCSVNRDCID